MHPSTCVLGCLPLRIIEVSWHGDNRMLDVLAQVCLCGIPHLGQDHAADLLWAKGLELALELHLHIWLCGLVHDLVRHQLGIALHLLVLEAAVQRCNTFARDYVSSKA